MADVKQWITVHPNGADGKGQPIPVMEGQSKGEAVKNFVNKHKSEVKELNKKSTDELKRLITMSERPGMIGDARRRTINEVAKTLNSELSDTEKKTLLIIQDPESDMRTVVWKTDKVLGNNVDKMYRGKPIYKEAVQRHNPQTGSWKTVEENNISEDDYNDYLDD